MLRRFAIVAVALAVVSGLAASPAQAYRSGSTHLDGRMQGLNNQHSYWNLCDDFGGSGWYQDGTDPNCPNWHGTVSVTENGEATEFDVSGGAECIALGGHCTAQSNLVGVVEAMMAADFGGVLCASSATGINGVISAADVNRIVLWNLIYTDRYDKAVWDHESWAAATQRNNGENLNYRFYKQSTNVVAFAGASWILQFGHPTTNDTVIRDYFVSIPFDGAHGTNYDTLDAGYGPDC
jgi:hypothetical protein